MMKKFTLISLVGLIVGVILLLGGMSLIGFDFAIAEPAYAASATGGVMSATIPK